MKEKIVFVVDIIFDLAVAVSAVSLGFIAYFLYTVM